MEYNIGDMVIFRKDGKVGLGQIVDTAEPMLDLFYVDTADTDDTPVVEVLDVVQP